MRRVLGILFFIALFSAYGFLGNQDSIPSSKSSGFSSPRLKLEEVSFSGIQKSECPSIERDDGTGTYKLPQWNPSRNFPIACVAGRAIKIDAKFTVYPGNYSGSFYVEAESSEGFNIPRIQVHSISGVVHVTAVVTPFLPKKIESIDRLRLQWKYALNEKDVFADAGTSSNQCYVLWDIPRTLHLFHTVLDISCRNAKGKTSEAEIVKAIWSDFSTPTLPGVLKADRMTHMTFWNKKAQLKPLYTTQDLVRDNDGRCEAWASLFCDTLLVQGIQRAEPIEIQPLPNEEHANFVFQFSPQIAQGNIHPPNQFVNHYIVLLDKNVYDPSYGTFFPSYNEWIGKTIKALVRLDTITQECTYITRLNVQK
jgi:hypothetical protein